MPQNHSITDFFKPFTRPQGRRPAADDQLSSDAQRRPWHSAALAKQLAETGDIPSTSDALPTSSIASTHFASNTAAPLPSSSPLSPPPSSSSNAPQHLTASWARDAVIPTSESEEDDTGDTVMDDRDALDGADDDNSVSSLEDVAAILIGGADRGPNTHKRRIERQRSYKRSAQLPEPNYKYSLKRLVAQTSEENAARARVAEIQSRILALEQAEAEHDRQSRTPDQPDVNEKLLESVLEGDDDGDGRAQKLLQALKRTDAFRRVPAWNFFTPGGKPSAYLRPPFPADSVQEPRWRALLQDPMKRDSAFISGAVKCLARTPGGLPHEIATWLCQEAVSEPRESLTHAYIAVLTCIAEDVAPILDANWLDAVISSNLHPAPDALRLDRPILVELRSLDGVDPAEAEPPAGLARLIDLLNATIEYLSSDVIVHALSIFLRLLIDDTVLRSASCQKLLQLHICTLITALPASEAPQHLQIVATRLQKTVQTPQLQSALMAGILPTSPRLAMFARGLALAFFLGADTPLTTPVSRWGKTLIPAIITTLDTIAATPRQQLDVVALAARVTLLDVGFANHVYGLLDSDEPAFPAAGGSNDGELDLCMVENGDAEAARREDEGEEEDEAIETMTYQLERLAASVGAAGGAPDASLSRAEARAALERLVWRLDYAASEDDEDDDEDDNVDGQQHDDMNATAGPQNTKRRRRRRRRRGALPFADDSEQDQQHRGSELLRKYLVGN